MVIKKEIDSSILRTYSQQQLIDEINGDVSLLKSLGANELLEEMLSTGSFCLGLIDLVCAEKDDEKLRDSMSNALKAVAPTNLFRNMPKDDNCIVVGFNHPSLGEILRLGYICLKAYPDREFLFPVNIPWYETLTPDIPKLERMKVHITPMITPKTEEKLISLAEGSEEKLDDIRHYKTLFEKAYMKAARKCAENKGVIIVAPSATRQASVFASDEERQGIGHIHPTMTLLARVLLRKPDDLATFLPVTVLEPANGNRNLNLFRNYRLYPCEPFSSEEVRSLTAGHSRNFDYEFLKRIDHVYQHKGNFRLIHRFIRVK